VHRRHVPATAQHLLVDGARQRAAFVAAKPPSAEGVGVPQQRRQGGGVVDDEAAQGAGCRNHVIAGGQRLHLAPRVGQQLGLRGGREVWAAAEDEGQVGVHVAVEGDDRAHLEETAEAVAAELAREKGIGPAARGAVEQPNKVGASAQHAVPLCRQQTPSALESLGAKVCHRADGLLRARQPVHRRLERREQRPLLRQEELQRVVRVEDRVGVGDVGAAVRKGALVHG